MAIGDQNDIANRIRTVLPDQWFPISPPGGPSATPVLDGVLAGPGSIWATMYSLLQYARLQTRIATATDFFLDLIGYDFYGTALLRLLGETDPDYSLRIRKNLLREKATRAGMIRLLTDITGYAPRIIEPANTGDTGGWDTGAMGWDTAGCWGDILPFTVFITVYRLPGGGIGGVEGWYDVSETAPELAEWDPDGGEPAQAAGWDQPGGGQAIRAGWDSVNAAQVGGWDNGAIEWTDSSMVKAQLTDDDIYAAIHDCMPVAHIAWVAITTPASGSGHPFVLGSSLLGGSDTL